MKNNYTKIMALSLLFSLNLHAQVKELGTNRVEINMSEADRESLKQSVKSEVSGAEMRIYKDGQLVETSKISVNTRGQTSMKKPRKNFGVESALTEEDKKQKLAIGSVSGKNLLLSAGSADPLLVKNMISYRLMDLAEVPAFESDYLEVIINNQSEGLYMVTRSATDQILKHQDSEDIAVFRRRYNDAIELKKAKKDVTPEEIQAMQKQLTEMHRSLKSHKGQDRVDFLSKQLNLDHYLRSMAINYLIHNSDSSDEMFYSAKKQADGTYYFDVLPWDLDDSFGSAMHLQKIPLNFDRRAAKLGLPEKLLIYNYEGRIEQAVAEDPVMMKLYFETFQTLLDENLTDANIEATFNEVSSKLSPYLGEAAILEAGVKDLGAAYETAKISADLASKKQAVKDRIVESRKVIEAALSENKFKTKKFGFITKKLGFFEMNVIQKVLNKREKKADALAEKNKKQD